MKNLLNTNLKWLRNSFSFSLKELSKSLDIKISTLNSYEDNTFPRIDTLQRLVNWYAQAIPTLTIDDLVNFKLEEKYNDADFTFFDEMKSSSGYQTKKSTSFTHPQSDNKFEKLKIEAFNNIIKYASDEGADPEIVKEMLFTFNMNFKNK